MNPIVDEIIFKCSRSVLEDPSNLFGEIIYRNFDINICDSNSSVLKTSFLPGKIITNSRGIPSLIFLGCSLLKDNCCHCAHTIGRRR